MTILLLLAPLVFSFAIGQDIFVPEVPQIVKIFHTSQATVQLTLSLFMLAVGAGQLIVGPLSDQFGRKKIVLFSIALYVVGSIIAASSATIVWLISARIIEGIGACGMMVCAFAIVRDLMSGAQSARIYSFLNGAIAVSPLIAPLLGGYLDVWFGWRAPFIALAVIGTMIFISTLLTLDETLSREKQIHFNFSIFKRYWSILKNIHFLIYTFSAATALAIFFTFFSISSYLLIEVLKVPETRFGIYFATIGIVFFIGSIVSGKLSVKIGIYKTILLGAFGLVISGLWMLVWTFTQGTSLESFMLPTALSGFTGAFLLGAGAGGALEPFGEMAGTAAALLGACEFLMATAVASITLLWPVKSNLSYAIPLTLLSCLVLVCLLFFKNVLNKSKSE